jgi:aspartyl protease family protein
MDLLPFSDSFAWLRSLPQSGLVLTALAAMLVGFVGSWFRPPLGRLLRTMSTLGLMGVLVVIVLQLGRLDSRLELSVPQMGLPRQVVEGGETRIPMARDGHFWIDATVNGAPVRFMLDTGATLTAFSADAARVAGLEPRTGGLPVSVQTANGAVPAEIATVEQMDIGNIRAEGLDAVIVPQIGRMNVLGMNFLSRLGSWRVEGQTLILVPPWVEAPANE